MAQMHQQDPMLVFRHQPFAADFPTQTRTSSMLFSMLPAAVQSRLPQIPSIRRSVSEYGLANRRRATLANSRPSSVTSTGTRTPDAGYTNALILSDTRAVMADEEMTGYFDSASSDEENAAGFRRCKGKHLDIDVAETKSGIGWKFANQGLSLLSLAFEESSTISQGPNSGNASFARQLYIHALTYLLRALPDDLSAEEQISVRGALPPGVVKPLQLSNGFISGTHHSTPEQPSLLHRTLATTIIQLFILAQFILPYLKYLLATAYQYDREHKISEKVLSQGIETVDSLGKTGLRITGAVYGMGDGKVGQLITETAAWFIEGVTGGIHEGVGEGMVLMGAASRRSPSPKVATEKR